MMDADDQIRADLAYLSEYRKALARVDRMQAEAHAAIRRLDAAGVMQRDIVTASGITRDGIRKIILRTRR